MNYTTERQKEIAELIANEITEQGKQYGAADCIVDDFGRFGNFALVCYLDVKRLGKWYRPNKRNVFNLTLLVNVIKKAIKKYEKEGANKRSHECPQGMYSTQRIRNWTESHFEGYEKNYIYIDLDFNSYHAESNTFSVQTPVEQPKFIQGKLF